MAEQEWTAESGYAEARRRIAACGETRATSLDLRNLKLRRLPPEVVELTWLEELDVGGHDIYQCNKIGADGARALAALKGLTTLCLDSNDIGDDGARALSVLTGLTTLDLGGNQIGDDGARALSALTGLTALKLWDNEIGCAGARALAKLTRLTMLDLSESRIPDDDSHFVSNLIGDDGARALAALTDLTALYLSNNRIGDDGARALAALTGLTALDLSNNWIGNNGARALAALTGLTALYLSNGGIGDDGAQALSKLTGLRMLVLDNNEIGADGARALAALTGLTTMYLGSNNIGDDGARALSVLTGLTTLNLDSNEISDITPLLALDRLETLSLNSNTIRTACPALWFKPALRRVSLHDATLGEVPKELLSSVNDLVGFNRNSVPRLQAYFRDRAGGETVVRDVKTMILGNGRIGKTQIARRLRNESFEDDANSTHGVQLRGAVLPAADGTADPAQGATPLQIWDFGGQDIYLGTHALFLRTRAIFPIVWTPASDAAPIHTYAGMTSQNWPLDYWVAYVAQMAGPGNPIVLIQNQVDGPSDKRVPPPVPAARLAEFAFHRDLAYSARTNRGHATLLDALNQAVEYVHTTEGLKSIGGGWAAVKRALEKQGEASGAARATGSADRSLAMMDRAAFDDLCAKPEVTAAGGVSDTDVLLGFLHNIGTVFHRDHLFDGRIVIDQQWALEAIYAVFERENGVAKHITVVRCGRFTRPELDRYLWATQGYGESEQRLFLSLMTSCGIAFMLRGKSHDDETEYLAPDLLPPQASVQDWLDDVWDDSDQAPTERAVFRYDLVPPGLLRDLMGAIGKQAGVAALYWKDGFSFYDATTRSRALVRQVRSDSGWAGYIEVLTQRRAGRNGDAGALLDAMIRLVAEKQDRLGVRTGEVPEVTRSTGVVAALKRVVGLGERGPSAREIALIEGAKATEVRLREGEGRPHCEGPPIADGLLVDTLPVAPTAEPQPANAVYVSYAWGSTAAKAKPEDIRREKVVDALCEAARKQGVHVIRDRDVMRFGDSITNYMDQLAEGQRIVVVLSSKYLKSPFCMYELYKIWKKYEVSQEEFRRRVRVVMLPDAKIGDALSRDDCENYWRDQLVEYDRRIKLKGVTASRDLTDSAHMIKEFAETTSSILRTVADMLNFTRIEDIAQLRLD